MENTHTPCGFARLRRWLIRASASLACLYLVLLIPEGAPPAPTGAGKQPFAWNQNAIWSELERQFVQARNTGCEHLTGRIDTAIAQITAGLGEISAGPRAPDDPAFAALETNLFGLAPLIGACPQRLEDFGALVIRARAEVKRQSLHWAMDSAVTRQRLYRLL